MPPHRVQKRKTTTSAASTSPPQRASRQALTSTKTGSPARTPRRIPTKAGFTLTQSQKQALIDNLQLEITERARKLRAQYALQSQALRTRLEIRVHRIPAALRKTTIGELLEKYAKQGANAKPVKVARLASKSTFTSPIKLPKSPAKNPQPTPKQISAPAQPQRAKRKSDDFEADKENVIRNANNENPSKRPRTGAPTAPNGTRNPSNRVIHPSQILSPKSTNSRTLPQPPFKGNLPSPIKSNIARPVSPLKPSVTAPTATSLAKNTDKPATGKARTVPSGARAASKTSNTATARTKRGAAAPPPRVVEASNEDGGRPSDVSEATSQGTTIVRQVKKTLDTSTLKKTGTVARAVNAANKKIAAHAAAKADAAGSGATVKGGRTLRKRA